VLDTVHAEAQAMWDIRRLLGWAREQGAPLVGTYGLSLGGYTTALLAGLTDELACAIAGIPLTDLSSILWRHGPRLQLDYLSHTGTAQRDVDEVFRVVSPLAVEPRVPKDGRLLFGGVADRLVTPDHVRNLWEHWERPQLVWYQGGHVTFTFDPRVHEAVDATLRKALPTH
jgi:dienelactone hydrolase